ncbi:MAG: hypothetical protein ACE5EU_10845 [Paracoccaceae bacterium]
MLNDWDRNSPDGRGVMSRALVNARLSRRIDPGLHDFTILATDVELRRIGRENP